VGIDCRSTAALAKAALLLVGLGLNSNCANAATWVADAFQHPLANSVNTKSATVRETWYLAKGFGDPLGSYCDTLKSQVCYSLGEDWRPEPGNSDRRVHAIANGEILDFGYSRSAGGLLPGSLGNYVLIKHVLPTPGRHIAGYGRVTSVVSLYAHLSNLAGICGEHSTGCRIGQRVKIGQVIGRVGSTGAPNGAGARLHFEIRLVTEKCRNNSQTAAKSCLEYSKDRYPVRYMSEGGWVDPTCFIENRNLPRNDNFADAIPIEVGATRKGANYCATKEPGEPNHAGKRINKHGFNSAGKSVWWKFTASESTSYTVSTIGSDFDTLLSVYASNTSVGGLAAVAHNDNERRRLCSHSGYCVSKITFAASAGTTYYIAVDGASSADIAPATGQILLTISEADAQLFVTPSATFFTPAAEGMPFTGPPINYQVSASKDQLAYAISNVPPWLTPSRTFGHAGRASQAVSFKVNAAAKSLKAGTYTAAIVVASTGQDSQIRTLTLKVKEASTLQVTPTTAINVTGDQGGPFNTTSFAYEISATSGNVSYAVSGVPNWLTVSMPPGAASTTPKTVTFTVNSTADRLTAGTYNATIRFTNKDSGKGTIAIPAVLTVNPAAALQIDPASAVVVSGLQGGPFSPASFSYQIKTSRGTSEYAISGVPSWLTASSLSGTATTTPATVTFTVNANANSLAAGAQSATITFTNTTNGQGTTSRSVALVVNALPGLLVAPAIEMVSSGPQGGPFSASSFDVALSSTTGTVSYSISGVPSWLNASQTSGVLTSSPSNVTFTFNDIAYSLAPGTYHADIVFTNATNGLGNTTRPVDLTVAAPPAPQYLTDSSGGYVLDSSGARLLGS
jgi:murein DD-endopeptidase MepM/ murein hydrolase activator NlpD